MGNPTADFQNSTMGKKVPDIGGNTANVPKPPANVGGNTPNAPKPAKNNTIGGNWAGQMTDGTIGK